MNDAIRRLLLGCAGNIVLFGLLAFCLSQGQPEVRPVRRARVIALAMPRLEVPPPAVTPPPPPKLKPRRFVPPPPSKTLAPQTPAPPVLAATPTPLPPAPSAPSIPLPPPKPIVGAFEQAAAPPPRPKIQRLEPTQFDTPATPRTTDSSRTTAAVGAFDSAPAAKRAPAAQVASTGFDAPAPATQSSRPPIEFPTAFQPVEILSKPKPQYTEAARQLKIEGEVIVRVLFGADGHLHVLSVERGLGHGLDENAAVAAARIQFRPAQRNGKPVEQAALIRVQFQLAQ